MGKYFGASSSRAAQPQDKYDEYRQKAEDWVKRHPGAALALGLAAGVLIIRSPGLRKLALPLVMVAARRMFTK